MEENQKASFSVTRKDMEISFFSGTGAGGQHRNKHMNCCRIRHKDTGIIVTGQSYREKPRNIRQALENLANNAKFKAFCDLRLKEVELGKTFEQMVDEAMNEKNLLIQVKDESGRWIDEPDTIEQ